MSLPRTLPALIPTLLFTFLALGCGGSGNAKADAPEAVKIDPPELVLRNFYAAIDNQDNETIDALLTRRARAVDPKGGSLIANTTALVQQNDGIAKFDVLKVGAEIIEVEQTEDGPGKEQRTVTVEFEITFNNGETRRSESQLVYEQVNASDESEASTGSEAAAPAPEFGWRVEGVRQVWQ